MRPEGGDSASIWDIADAARTILRSVNGVSHAEWAKNRDLKELTAYRLAIIGEAANRVSLAMKARHPEIPWRQMINQRNILIHAYDHVDYDLVWRLVQHQLGTLLSQIESLLPPGPDTSGSD